MSTLAQMISSAFPGGQRCLCSADDIPVVASSRRRKLWELPHAYHCALIGTCLPVADMRRLAPHSGYDVSNMTDYSLHTVVVGYCEGRCALGEAIQRFFDKRYAHAIARFAPAASVAALALLWREALAGGSDIPGALWAAWTHPAMDDELGRDMHGDIHMLSHQTGAAVRADLRELESARHDAVAERAAADKLRHELDTLRRTHDAALAGLRAQLAGAEQRAAAYQRHADAAAGAEQLRRQFDAEQQRANALAARLKALEQRNATTQCRADDLARELHATRDELAAAEQALCDVLGQRNQSAACCASGCPAEAPLNGRCVLCVGGRSGLVDGYRKLVEQRGGRFLHHDGGQEEHLHRIDAAIANADAVVCQTACVSHAAYWRLKDACKKLGKPCVFVQSPGVGSFARSLAALTHASPDDQVIRLPA